MTDAVRIFSDLKNRFSKNKGVESGQMFGKPCLKVGGKAFAAQQNDLIVFKLADPEHAKALKAAGASLWDPSGKGRPMKEWVALPSASKLNFAQLADAACNYVGG